jgi:2-methylcitrate dehydratase PrpD
LLASDASWHAAEACLQCHGGFGFAREYDVERKWRETRLFQIAPISTNMVLSYVERAHPGHAPFVLEPVQPAMAQGLTHALAEFVARRLDPPADAVRIATNGFIDTLATMAAGQSQPVVNVVRKFVRERQSVAAEASILLGSELAGSADARAHQWHVGHALDYDDVALGGHPSTVLVPAVLAEGESLAASGAEAIRAYIVGYEVWAELAAREPDPYHEKGWHPTAVLGTVGAAAAAAYLHKLPVDACRNAHRACRQHVERARRQLRDDDQAASRRSRRCVRHRGRSHDAARPDGFAGRHRTPCRLPRGTVAAKSLRSLGCCQQDRRAAAHCRRGLSIKRYPMCYSAHRTIDGVLDMVAANDIGVDDVSEVRVTIGTTQASMLRNHAPANALEAKFSIEFAVASALVARSVGLRELTDEFVTRDSVQRAMAKVRTQTVDTHCTVEPVFSFADRVVLQLGNGTHARLG